MSRNFKFIVGFLFLLVAFLAFSNLYIINFKIADFKKTIQLNPNLGTNYGLARADNKDSCASSMYAGIGDPDQEISMDTKMLSLEKNHFIANEYYESRGSAYYLKGNLDQAISDYNKAIALKPKLFFYMNRGNAYYLKGNYDQAIFDYNKEIELGPSIYIYINRGNAYFVKGNYDQAISDYNKAIRLSPVNSKYNPEVYINRGAAYFASGNYVHPMLDYIKSIIVKMSLPKGPGPCD